MRPSGETYSIFETNSRNDCAWAEENGDLRPKGSGSPGRHDRDMEDARNHELTIAAEDYAVKVRKWFEGWHGSLGRQRRSKLRPANRESIQEASGIHWYQFQIAAKTVRANVAG